MKHLKTTAMAGLIGISLAAAPVQAGNWTQTLGGSKFGAYVNLGYELTADTNPRIDVSPEIGVKLFGKKFQLFTTQLKAQNRSSVRIDCSDLKNGKLPGVSVDANAPDVSTSGVSAPDASLSDVDAPNGNLSGVNAPNGGLPGVNMPNGSLPGVNVNMPNGSLPGVNVNMPNGGLPGVNADVPDGSLPGVNVNMPNGNLPGVNADMPNGSLPGFSANAVNQALGGFIDGLKKWSINGNFRLFGITIKSWSKNYNVDRQIDLPGHTKWFKQKFPSIRYPVAFVEFKIQYGATLNASFKSKFLEPQLGGDYLKVVLDVGPSVSSQAFVDGSVSAWVLKGGVKASLTLFEGGYGMRGAAVMKWKNLNAYCLQATTSVPFLKSVDIELNRYFYMKALSGKISAYVKRKKFKWCCKLKWKTWKTWTLAKWKGFSMRDEAVMYTLSKTF